MVPIPEASVARRSFSLPFFSSATTTTTWTQQQAPSSSSSHVGVVSPLIYPPQSGIRTVSSSSSSCTYGIPVIQQHQNHHPYHHPTLNPVSPTQPSEMSNYVWDNQQQQPHAAIAAIHDTNTMKHLLPQHRTTLAISVKHERSDGNTTVVEVPFVSSSSSSSSLGHPNSILHNNVVVQQLQQPYSSAAKKQRSNGYIAPKHIPDTYTSRVGSLAVGKTKGSHANHMATKMNTGNNNDNDNSNSHASFRQVSFRRQLSSSKIECFLNGDNHDGMDMDTSEVSRPRSMSF
jgi:hypothetical protein